MKPWKLQRAKSVVFFEDIWYLNIIILQGMPSMPFFLIGEICVFVNQWAKVLYILLVPGPAGRI